MRTNRIYFEDINIASKHILIINEYVRYLNSVLRLKPKSIIYLFNNNDGFEYKCEIQEINNKKILINVISSELKNNETLYNVNLYQSLIKNDNFDLVIQKATELGAKSITPIITERTNHKFDAKSFDKKITRWQKIAINSAEQCGRVFYTKINNPIELKKIDFNNILGFNITLCPYTESSFKKIQNKILDFNDINIFIGPEGGFSDKEIALFDKLKNNFKINLGPRVLRAETVPISVMSIINLIK